MTESAILTPTIEASLVAQGYGVERLKTRRYDSIAGQRDAELERICVRDAKGREWLVMVSQGDAGVSNVP